VTPRRQRVKLFLGGLGKLIALVVVAGGVGVALGTALSKVSSDDATATADVAAENTGPDDTFSTTPTQTAQALPPATTTTSAAQSTATTSPPTTTPKPQSNRFADVRVDVLDARLHTDDAPSGNAAQNARVTVRVRADNGGSRRLQLDPPSLRIGSVRVPVDTNANAGGFDPLPAGAGQTVTLRFSLAGEATPKLVRDRRARLFVAGRSVAIRIKIRRPS
jgi:pyruvate/2-oxoglutarate dehydrogenase complex dihydrolipoamide acyltransferase (E2) component